MREPVRAFMSAKRSARRHACKMVIRVSGPTIWVAGETVDISANGLCIRLAVKDLLPYTENPQETTPFDLVQMTLGEGLKLLFPTSEVLTEGIPVRVAPDPERPGWLHLGCRLPVPFSTAELERLQLRVEDCGPEDIYRPASESLPKRVRKPLEVELSRVDDRDRTLFVGEVMALGDMALAVRIRDQNPHEILQQVGCLELYFRVKRDGDTVWASRATMAALPTATSIRGTVEMGLAASEEPADDVLASIAVEETAA